MSGRRDDGARLACLLGAAGAVALGRAVRARRRVSFRDRVVVITGGSRGLGLVTARLLAEEGAKLVLLARTAPDLDRARAELEGLGAEVLTVACDVQERDGVEDAVRQTLERFGRLDAVLHDAGVIEVGAADNLSEADYREAMGVHFWGAYYLTEAVRPHLPRDGSARIGYVSSIGWRVAVPHLAAYSASKHALVGYADAMRAALARDGVRVTTIAPGLMRTGSHVNAQFKGQHAKEYAWFAVGDANPLLSVSAETAARRIVDALRHGDAELTISLPAKLLALLDGVFPGAVGAVMKGVERLLPDPDDGPEGEVRKTGWQSRSALAPALLTGPADRAVARNNELRGHEPPV